VIIRPDLRLVDPGFLFRYLRSRAGQAFLLGMSTGKKIRVLNVRAMYEIPVPLPDLTTQKAVGDNFTRAEQRLESERKRVESEYRDGADALFQKMGLLPASIDGENRFSD
jgi:restriction endonuclease S subunit